MKRLIVLSLLLLLVDDTGTTHARAQQQKNLKSSRRLIQPAKIKNLTGHSTGKLGTGGDWFVITERNTGAFRLPHRRYVSFPFRVVVRTQSYL